MSKAPGYNPAPPWAAQMAADLVPDQPRAHEGHGFASVPPEPILPRVRVINAPRCTWVVLDVAGSESRMPLHLDDADGWSLRFTRAEAERIRDALIAACATLPQPEAGPTATVRRVFCTRCKETLIVDPKPGESIPFHMDCKPCP